MTRDQVLSMSRLAGQVLRYHTWPVLHRQTVGEHTWQVMRIYHQLWGSLPPEVSSYILWHDAGELVTGDVPYPIKADNPKVKEAFDALEAAAVAAMCPNVVEFDDLTPFYKFRVKVCDLIEMWEFGLTEYAMGNTFAQPIISDIYKAIEKWPLSEPDRKLVNAYMDKSQL